ncbi:MAG: hypothetical protein WB562_06430 [Candidatus Sulfotelmatobacter sp.]
MMNPRQIERAVVLGLLLSMFALASVSAAHGQDFILTPSALTPRAVDPGVSATATISVQPVNTMSAPTVTLSCAVVPVETNGPTCQISDSVVAPATPALTVFTSGSTPQISYTITVTGTDGTGSQLVNFTLTVLAVIPDYTITVTTPMTPSTVTAGNVSTGVVTLTPINGYTGQVTLSCSMVTPPVIPAPQCSFNPATVSILTSSAAQPSTLTITTAGLATQLRSRRIFYAMWLLLPGLMLAGLGSVRGNGRKVLGCLLLMTIAAGILLIPACGGAGSTQTTTVGTGSGTTPNNTYTFTLTGADANGLGPSNTSPTVSLTVN